MKLQKLKPSYLLYKIKTSRLSIVLQCTYLDWKMFRRTKTACEMSLAYLALTFVVDFPRVFLEILNP